MSKDQSKINVYVNIYDLNPVFECLIPIHKYLAKFGFGMYHTGVEIDYGVNSKKNVEYSFGPDNYQN